LTSYSNFSNNCGLSSNALQPVIETPKSQTVLDKDTLAAMRLFQSVVVDKYPVAWFKPG